MDRSLVLGVLEREPTRAWPLKELLSALGLHDGREKSVRRVLKALVAEGLVDRDAGRRFRMSRAGQTIEGVVQRSENGRLILLTGHGKKAVPMPIVRQDADALQEGDRILARIERDKKGGT